MGRNVSVGDFNAPIFTCNNRERTGNLKWRTRFVMIKLDLLMKSLNLASYSPKFGF